MPSTRTLNHQAQPWTPDPGDLSAAPPAQAFVCADWAEHRSQLRVCHSADIDLRRLTEKQHKAKADRQSLDTAFKKDRDNARAATRQIAERLSSLRRELDASLKLSPKELRRVLRDLDQRCNELNTKQEALSRLQADFHDCTLALEKIEVARLNTAKSPATAGSTEPSARSTQEALLEASVAIKYLLRSANHTAHAMRKSLRQEVESKPSLALHLDGARLTEHIETITNTTIKRILGNALSTHEPTDETATADHGEWIHELLTRQSLQPNHMRTLFVGVLQTACVLALGINLLMEARRKMIYESAVDDVALLLRQLIAQTLDWWKPASEIIEMINTWDAKCKPISQATREWRDLMITIDTRFKQPGHPSLDRALAFRDALWHTRPYQNQLFGYPREESILEQQLKDQYPTVLDHLERSFAIFEDYSSLPSLPEPHVATIVTKLIGLVTLLVASGIFWRRSIQQTSTQKRANTEAQEIANRIAAGQSGHPLYGQLIESAQSLRSAIEKTQRHPSQTTDAWDKARHLATRSDSSLEELVAALSNTHATLTEHHRKLHEVPTTPPQAAALDRELALARGKLETKRLSLVRKKSEIEVLEKTVAGLTEQLEAKMDIPGREPLMAKIAAEQTSLQTSLEAEQDIEERYQRDRRKSILQSLEMDTQARALRDQLDHAETSGQLDATRDAIKRLATPLALSRAMERHTALPAEALESRLRTGRFTGGQGQEVSTQPIELASSYHSIHALHLALIDAIAKAPHGAVMPNNESQNIAIDHETDLGTTVYINDRNEARETKAFRSMVRYCNSPDGRLLVAHIHPA